MLHGNLISNDQIYFNKKTASAAVFFYDENWVFVMFNENSKLWMRCAIFRQKKNRYFDKCDAQNLFFLCTIMMTKSFIQKDFFRFFWSLQIKMSGRWIHVNDHCDSNKCLQLIEIQFCLHVHYNCNIIHKLWFFFDSIVFCGSIEYQIKQMTVLQNLILFFQSIMKKIHAIIVIKIRQKLRKLQFFSFNTAKKIVEKMLIIFILNDPWIADFIHEHVSDEQQSQLMNDDMNNVVIKTMISIFIIFHKITFNACESIN